MSRADPSPSGLPSPATAVVPAHPAAPAATVTKPGSARAATARPARARVKGSAPVRSVPATTPPGAAAGRLQRKKKRGKV
ncbi:hypothetical protein [Geomonas paludis]|uniref:hypothetical protein n=1 Tax=Geomonas paludis TaxID=2740185 RepID=UPI00160DFF50|nr:hypothetical protein [Geomonas paludis]